MECFCLLIWQSPNLARNQIYLSRILKIILSIIYALFLLVQRLLYWISVFTGFGHKGVWSLQSADVFLIEHGTFSSQSVLEVYFKPSTYDILNILKYDNMIYAILNTCKILCLMLCRRHHSLSYNRSFQSANVLFLHSKTFSRRSVFGLATKRKILLKLFPKKGLAVRVYAV